MNIRKVFLGIAIFFSMEQNIFAQESLLPTHIAQIRLDPSRYIDFVRSLDLAMKASGLLSYAAAPGLRELRGRDVLYIAYRSQPSGKWAFVTATDIIKTGTVEMRVYSTVLTDARRRKDTMARLDSVLEEFGAELKERIVQSLPSRAD